MNSKKIKVLYLCTGNSCRSQMAEGFLKAFGKDKYEAFSAGTKPTQVNPLSIKAMDEIGIDISSHSSQSVEEFCQQTFDFVITVCGNAKETCPAFPGEYKGIHWDLEDPADAVGNEEEKMTKFREIRDKIKRNVSDFIKRNS